MDPIEVEVRERTNQRLKREEADEARNCAKVRYSLQYVLALYRYSHPNIGPPRQLRAKLPQTFAAFGEHLERVLRAINHDVEDLPYEGLGDVRMKYVAHRVDKERCWPSYLARIVKPPGVFHYLSERSFPPEALGQSFCVAVLTALTDFGTASYRVPGALRPFN